jgi:SlyX protein
VSRVSEQALVELQSRIAFQDDVIEELSRAVAQQQRSIERLTEELARLAREVRGLARSPVAGSSVEEPPPPHY